MRAKGKKDNYELITRMDQIDEAYPDPGPQIWPQGAAVIKSWCPDDWMDIFQTCGITQEGAKA